MNPDQASVEDGVVHRATGSDVARRAGVSRATVSYVLNNAANRTISERTRKKVLDAAAELGHFPHASARALRSGRSDVVLSLVPGYTVGLLYGVLLDRLDDVVTSRGYGLLVHRHSEKRLSLTELWGLVNPELVILFGGLSLDEVDALQKSPARIVRMDNLLNHVDVGRMQATYLIDSGHTELGFAQPADPALRQFAAGRFRGIAEVCRERGIAPPRLQVVDLDGSDAGRAIQNWSDAGVTAIAAHNDDVGMLLLAALRAHQANGGEKLAVIGVDDLPMAALGLTTIRFASAVIADHLERSVLAALEGEEPPAAPVVPMQIIVRDSA